MATTTAVSTLGRVHANTRNVIRLVILSVGLVDRVTVTKPMAMPTTMAAIPVILAAVAVQVVAAQVVVTWVAAAKVAVTWAVAIQAMA